MSRRPELKGKEIRDKEDRLLLEMTELSADLARDMAARARKAEVREDAERYSRACDRMIRSMRLCIALRRRLERLDARDEAQRRVEAVDLRKARLRASLRNDIREACANPNRRFELDRELDETLAHEALYDRFVVMPLGQVMSRLRAKLDLPDPPPQEEVDRDASRETEGGEERGFAEGKADAIDNELSIAATNARSHLSGPQPPHPTASGAPPPGRIATRPPELRSPPPEGVEMGEHLEAAILRPVPS